jgi:hypothetical protein
MLGGLQSYGCQQLESVVIADACISTSRGG